MGNIIFGVAILSACIAPFILISLNKSRKDRKMAGIFRDLVAEINLKPGQFEVSGNTILGMNDEVSHFFFYKEREGKTEKLVVPLTQYVQCNVQKTGVASGLSANSSAPVHTVSLHFTHRDKGMSDVQVKIFDITKDLQLNDELKIADKWAQKVQSGLQKK